MIVTVVPPSRVPTYVRQPRQSRRLGLGVAIGFGLGLLLTQANGLLRPLTPVGNWLPVVTTYGAEGPSENSGIVAAIPGLACVGVETVGDRGVFGTLLGDC